MSLCNYCVYHRNMYVCNVWYGVATTSRLLKMIGLFCKRALQKRRYSANYCVYHMNMNMGWLR